MLPFDDPAGWEARAIAPIGATVDLKRTDRESMSATSEPAASSTKAVTGIPVPRRSRTVLGLVDRLVAPTDVAFAVSGVGAEHFVGVDVVRLVP